MMRNILVLRITRKEWPRLVSCLSDPCFSYWDKKNNSTPAQLVGVHTSALVLCDILAVKSHTWLIIVIISQWDGRGAQGIIAASRYGRYGHLGVPHSPAVLGCSEGVWMLVTGVGAIKPEADICPPQLDTEARWGSWDSWGPEDSNSLSACAKPQRFKAPLKPSQIPTGNSGRLKTRPYTSGVGRVDGSVLLACRGGSEAPITTWGHLCYWEGIRGEAGWNWLLQVNAQAMVPFHLVCIG